jgi:nucleoside-diphosphate-sugar epimerase
MRSAYEANDRIRAAGSRNLLEAANGARYVTQSVAFFGRPTGEPGLRDEDTPLWTDAPAMIGETARVVGAGVDSFVHVDDPAAATVNSLTAPSGVYSVVDDHPAPTRQWLPAFAEALQAPPPRHLPAAPVKLVAKPYVAWQESLEGQSNARAKAALDRTPVQPSWRTAFRDP